MAKVRVELRIVHESNYNGNTELFKTSEISIGDNPNFILSEVTQYAHRQVPSMIDNLVRVFETGNDA